VGGLDRGHAGHIFTCGHPYISGVRSIKLVTLSTLFVLAAAGCDPAPKGDTASPASAAPSVPSAASASPSGAAGGDNRKVCADVDSALRQAQAKITEAEAIGPPAGHFAVSAAYYAGAASIDALLVGARGPVAEAGTKVSDAMAAVGGKYDSPQARPDKTPLDTAIARFRAACAG
jgi:hypothetical protein